MLYKGKSEMFGDEEQTVRSLVGNEYSPDHWVWCVQCDEVFQTRDLVDGDNGYDYCPKCGAHGLDQDIHSVDSDLISDEIRWAYEEQREAMEGKYDDGEDVDSTCSDYWLFDGMDE